MSSFKVFLTLMFFVILLSLTSCGGHLPADKHLNPAIQGYHRMEFDVGVGDEVKKEIGIGNINLKEGQDLTGIYFKIYGLYKGTLFMKSAACGIDFTTRFDGISTFNLDELIQYPTKCSIKITAETDKINNREHNIVESGIIKLNVIPVDSKSLTIEYTRTNTAIKSLYKIYTYEGQGSIQRQEGDLTSAEKFIVKTDLTVGGLYRITGCDNTLTGSFDVDLFEIDFKNLYAKNYLAREDSCDFEIIIIPNEVIETYLGRFSVNIYGQDVVKLESLDWDIKKQWNKERLYVWGGDHIVACGINNTVKTANNYDVPYLPDTEYWIRSITANGRKSVFAIKDNTVVWKE